MAAMRLHPTSTLLQRFLRDETASAERCAVVRHLLTGCPKCLAMIRPTWITADRMAGRRAPRPQVARRRSDLRQ